MEFFTGCFLPVNKMSAREEHPDVDFRQIMPIHILSKDAKDEADAEGIDWKGVPFPVEAAI